MAHDTTITCTSKNMHYTAQFHAPLVTECELECEFRMGVQSTNDSELPVKQQCSVGGSSTLGDSKSSTYALTYTIAQYRQHYSPLEGQNVLVLFASTLNRQQPRPDLGGSSHEK